MPEQIPTVGDFVAMDFSFPTTKAKAESRLAGEEEFAIELRRGWRKVTIVGHVVAKQASSIMVKVESMPSVFIYTISNSMLNWDNKKEIWLQNPDVEPAPEPTEEEKETTRLLDEALGNSEKDQKIC